MEEWVAGGCLTQPPGEEKMEVRRRRRPARTHQKSFTVSVREDWYGLGQAPLRDGCGEERMAAVEGWSRFSVTGFFFVRGKPISFKSFLLNGSFPS